MTGKGDPRSIAQARRALGFAGFPGGRSWMRERTSEGRKPLAVSSPGYQAASSAAGSGWRPRIMSDAFSAIIMVEA